MYFLFEVIIFNSLRMIAQRKKQNFTSFKTPRPDLISINININIYQYLSFIKSLYTVPGDGLKSVLIVTFFKLG